MEINWVVVGWIIDMILNGVVWLIIAAVSLPLIDIADKFPPMEPNAPPMEENLAFPLLFSKIKETASSTF